MTRPLPECDKTTDVHEALARARDLDDTPQLTHCNFKVHPLKKEAAERICKQNGTTISAFLRSCVDGIVKDYVGAKAWSQFEADMARAGDLTPG